jgi:hypothetical protein
MDRVKTLKDDLSERKKHLMRETCFQNLKDFLFFYNNDLKGKETDWTDGEEIKELASLITQIVNNESIKVADYYVIQSEYAHLAGSEGIGHAHTHGPGGHSHVNPKE